MGDLHRAAVARPFPRALSLLLGAMLVLVAACGDRRDAERTPGPSPSAEADALYAAAVEAFGESTSVRYEYEVFQGDDPVYTILNEQAEPDKARRVTDDKTSGVVTEAVIVGADICQREGEAEPFCLTLDPSKGEEPFAYPATWMAENGSLAGWALIGPERVDGSSATLISLRRADAETGGTSEELVYIDDATGRIVKWDVNKYQGEDAAPAQRWVSSTWRYNAPLEISLDGFEG